MRTKILFWSSVGRLEKQVDGVLVAVRCVSGSRRGLLHSDRLFPMSAEVCGSCRSEDYERWPKFRMCRSCQ